MSVHCQPCSNWLVLDIASEPCCVNTSCPLLHLFPHTLTLLVSETTLVYLESLHPLPDSHRFPSLPTAWAGPWPLPQLIQFTTASQCLIDYVFVAEIEWHRGKGALGIMVTKGTVCHSREGTAAGAGSWPHCWEERERANRKCQ